MSRRVVVALLVILALAVAGISYATVFSGQTAQPSTNTTSCKPETLAGNFTSASPQNNSDGPYNGTFYVQNLGSQPVTIANYTDQSGLNQRVNWTVPPTATGSFPATLYKTENTLVLETSCGTSFALAIYYPMSEQVKHYDVTLYVSLGGTAH